MVKRIIWSKIAIKSRDEILEYWSQRNRSRRYSIKLSKVFQRAINNLQGFSSLGKKTNRVNTRECIVINYSIFYEVTKKEIIILLIWDNRRNPKDLKLN